MKRMRILSTGLAILLILSACKKKNDGTGGCNSSGFISPNYYLFWAKTDFACGPITVTVKKADGSNVGTNYPTTTVYQPDPPGCTTAEYQNHATFQLVQGTGYTWKAACSGRSWSGTIQVPCEQNQCHQILIQ